MPGRKSVLVSGIVSLIINFSGTRGTHLKADGTDCPENKTSKEEIQ
jgi:hypothetical protein